MENRAFRNAHFCSLPLTSGLITDLTADGAPQRIFAWGYPDTFLEITHTGTHFGFVTQDTSMLIRSDLQDLQYQLTAGMYFAVTGAFRIKGGAGLLIGQTDYSGVFLVGGPIERTGRLRYIDGCSDSLIIPPVIKGDPCLNHLHFPKNISQTRHTHPSIRIGVVARGEGKCVVPLNDDGSGPDQDIPLRPGNVFIIPTGGQHSFFTGDDTMDVIAFHPDSDTGPEDDNHPMINRTFVHGTSAAVLDHIKTKRE